MSTTPATPATPVTTQLHPISVYLKEHERIVLVFIAGLVLWFGIGKVDSLIARHDNANLQQAQVAAQANAKHDEALTQQVAQDKAAYTALNEQVMARDAQLQQIQAQLVAALANRQAADKVLPPTDLVERWNVLVPAANATVTPNGVTLPEQGAVATVVELEKVPVLTQQVANGNEELSNAQKLVAAEGQQVTDRDTLIAGLRTQSVADARVCTEQIATVKAEARKSKRRWFVIGYFSGFLSRQAIKTYLGV